MAAIANTHAKAAANPKAQRPSYAAGPVSAPLVVNAAKPYSFAYEVVDPAGNFMEIDSYIKLIFFFHLNNVFGKFYYLIKHYRWKCLWTQRSI